MIVRRQNPDSEAAISDLLKALRISTVNGLAADDRPQDLRIARLFSGGRQYVPIQQGEISLLPRTDRSNLALLAQRTGGISRVGIQHRFTRDALAGLQNSGRSLARFGLINRLENIGRRNRPVTRTRDDAALVQHRARWILPLIEHGIDMRFHQLDRVRPRAGPVELERRDHTALAETR